LYQSWKKNKKRAERFTKIQLDGTEGINPSAIQKHMDKLKNDGVIAREGSDKKGICKVIID
jgi:predicted HTH transcriptional regulator